LISASRLVALPDAGDHGPVAAKSIASLTISPPQTILATGASDGIGYATARQFVARRRGGVRAHLHHDSGEKAMTRLLRTAPTRRTSDRIRVPLVGTSAWPTALGPDRTDEFADADGLPRIPGRPSPVRSPFVTVTIR